MAETKEALTAIEYKGGLRGVGLAMTILSQHDLPAMLEAARRSDAIGCFVDPTLYREKAEALRIDIETLEAALPLWNRFHKMAADLKELREKVAAKEPVKITNVA